MARYELILRLDGALWLRIISKPPLTQKNAMEGPNIPKEFKMPPGTGGNPCTRTNETWPYIAVLVNHCSRWLVVVASAHSDRLVVN